MKAFLICALCVAPSLGAAQVEDTTAINRQVDSLIQVSKTLTSEKKFEQALEANAFAENLALKKLGRISDAYGSTCFNHGRILHIEGNFADAERWYLDGLNIYHSLPGEVKPGYAKCLNNLALLYKRTFQYEKAEPLYQEVLSFRKKIQGQTAPDFAYCQHSMAFLFFDMQRFKHAEPLYLGALDQYEKVFGKDHPKYAQCLNGLATLYSEMGDYERAESLYEENIERQEMILGKEHSDYATSLNNLATLYLMMGLYEKAEPLYQTAKAIWEKELGKEDPLYTMSLDNLASLYLQTKSYGQAELLYRESLELIEATVGKDHPDYALNLEHLGLLYKRQGIYEEAEGYLRQAKTIYAQSLGTSHPDYAMGINNLADMYLEMGQCEKAEPLFLEGFGIVGKTLGTSHPDYLIGLQSLSGLYAALDDREKATGYFIQAAELQQSFLSRAVRHLSEQELGLYRSKFEGSQQKLLRFAAQTGGETSPLTEACYDNTLFHKGFLLYASNQIKTLSLSNQASAQKYYLLQSYEQRLAAQYAMPVDERTDVVQLEEKANALEKDLASTVAGFGEALQQVKWREVQQVLQAGEAAVEFVQYSSSYAALLLKPGMDHPQFIPLFEESALDKLLFTHSERRADYVNYLYTIPDRGLQPVGSGPEQPTLYELICQPLEKALKGIQTIYFSPVGLLHRLNLGAIPVPSPDEDPWGENQTLADRYHLIELGSTRQLVIPSTLTLANQDALLYGGVQYDLDPMAFQPHDPMVNDQPLASRSERGFVSRWNYLRWTEKEVSSLEDILESEGINTTTLHGHEATEESFKALGRDQPSPRILHLATHGYFFSDPETADGGRQTADGGRQTVDGRRWTVDGRRWTVDGRRWTVDGGRQTVDGGRQTADGEPIFKLSDHPMIRSGLILAGGNYAWAGGEGPNLLPTDREDGILTAYEISQINLSNTELVVLSACETGLGDIEGNEGVYGLQRAFKIAGARHLIMSLWQVPDQETALFMITFYKNWLEEKRTIPDAFRLTQQEMRERFIHPYSWAGFVLVE